MMDVGRNEPCPCGSGKKFKGCCRRSAESAAELVAAVHAVGRAAVLPVTAKAHLSMGAGCALCAGVPGAHTGFADGVELTGIDEILYALGGGAAEVACGLEPGGGYPASMAGELVELELLLGEEVWRELSPVLEACFEVLVERLSGVRDELLEVVRGLLERRGLVGVDFGFVGRTGVVERLAEILG